MSLVGRLGSGARSWVRIGLGNKVRVSISYYLIYVKTCSKHLIRRTALYNFNRGGSGYKITHNITLIVMVSVILFARWRFCVSSMLLLPIRM